MCLDISFNFFSCEKFLSHSGNANNYILIYKLERVHNLIFPSFLCFRSSHLESNGSAFLCISFSIDAIDLQVIKNNITNTNKANINSIITHLNINTIYDVSLDTPILMEVQLLKI